MTKARIHRPKPKSAANQEADTRSLLLEAAIEEFRLHGFGGTDTNRIARRAGFAPQTFYRWFKDKTDVFIAAYREWEEQERAVLVPLFVAGASDERMADAVIRQHREHLLFRRSLRQLSVEDPVVRAARAESRRRQMDLIRQWLNIPPVGATSLLLWLLQAERLADAAAEGELKDLGVADAEARNAMAGLLRAMKELGSKR